MDDAQQQPEDLVDDTENVEVTDEAVVESDPNLEKITELEKSLALEKEARLRLLADFQNFKKRSEAEKLEFRSFTNTNMLQQIADVVDDYERALTHEQDIEQYKDSEFYKGMQVVKAKLKSILEENGLKEIEVKPGDKFDPAMMEALTAMPVEDESDVNKVINVHNNAYIYQDTKQVFRTAKVVIGKLKNE